MATNGPGSAAKVAPLILLTSRGTLAAVGCDWSALARTVSSTTAPDQKIPVARTSHETRIETLITTPLVWKMKARAGENSGSGPTSEDPFGGIIAGRFLNT